MKRKRLIKRLWMLFMMPLFANIPFLLHVYPGLAWLLGPIGIGWFYINVFPYRDKEKPGIRLNVMRGGAVLALYALYGFALEAVILSILAVRAGENDTAVLAFNTVYALMICFFILWNGILRMFLLSVRLRLGTRILMILAMWIPGVNLAVLLYARKLVQDEYDFACYKEAVRHVRAESDLCKTKYPLIFVHGIGFRDLKYFNYWGRIPRELTRYGASVYYGNQEAMGTIDYNAHDIRKKILAVMAETGADKVNIIGHSKGGLDARYAVSRLGIEEYVASLTTINTPHHGCRFVDYACCLPEGIYRLTARCFDWMFRHFGDRNPDFYTATRQFSTITSKQFNQDVTDAPGVYYQSYASVMKDTFSDTLLWFPYLLIYALEGANDGLVSVESAKWGAFQEVFRSSRHRGISHGDMIDLKREDYRGFDVVESYVQLVAELKQKGF